MSINRFAAFPRLGRLNNITPFTYRDGYTYLQVVEELRNYINKLTEWSQDEFGSVSDAMQANLDELNHHLDEFEANNNQWRNNTLADIGEVLDANEAFKQSLENFENDVSLEVDKIRNLQAPPPSWQIGDAIAKIAGVPLFMSDNVRIGIASDSTGNDVNDWVNLWLKLYAPLNPEMRLVRRTWNSTANAYGPESVIQQGNPVPAVGGTVLHDTFDAAGNLHNSTPNVGNSWVGSVELALDVPSWEKSGGSAFYTVSTQGVGVDIGSRNMSLNANVRVKTGIPSDHLESVRFYIASDRSYAYLNNLYVSLGVNTAGILSCSVYKVANNVSTVIGTTDFGTLAPNDVDEYVNITVSLELSADTVNASIVGPTGTVTRNAQLTPAELSGMGTHVIMYGAGAPTNERFKVDNISVSTPYTPPNNGPGVTVDNASVPGASLGYHIPRLDQLFGNALDVMIVSVGHNYGGLDPISFVNEIDGFVEMVKTKHPDCSFIISSQNPQYPPRAENDRTAHSARIAALRNYAIKNGYSYVPVFEAFSKEADGGVGLVESDGLHPSGPPSPFNPVVGFGSTLWAVTFENLVESGQ